MPTQATEKENDIQDLLEENHNIRMANKILANTIALLQQERADFQAEAIKYKQLFVASVKLAHDFGIVYHKMEHLFPRKEKHDKPERPDNIHG